MKRLKAFFVKIQTNEYSKVTHMHSYQKVVNFIVFRLSTAWHMYINDSLTHIGIYSELKSSESRVRNTFVETANNNIPVRSTYQGVANNEFTFIIS